MLQQTTVATVIPRFTPFIQRWPTVQALAESSDEDVLGEWAGLGYYARARNLIACAREVARAGGFPTDEAELRKLPGIGDYTAAAVAAIAFGRDSTPIDTNVERVVARLYGLTEKAAIRRAAVAMTPAGSAGDFAQAMMDLGATICRPKAPECSICPLAADCSAFALGRPEHFPSPKVRRTRPHRHGVAYWHERNGSLFLVRRPSRGLLGGMAALPGKGWSENVAPPTEGIATIRHGFTHFTLELHVVERADAPTEEGWWQPLSDISGAGLPTLYRSAVEQVLSARRSNEVAQSPRDA